MGYLRRIREDGRLKKRESEEQEIYKGVYISLLPPLTFPTILGSLRGEDCEEQYCAIQHAEENEDGDAGVLHDVFLHTSTSSKQR